MSTVPFAGPYSVDGLIQFSLHYGRVIPPSPSPSISTLSPFTPLPPSDSSFNSSDDTKCFFLFNNQVLKIRTYNI